MKITEEINKRNNNIIIHIFMYNVKKNCLIIYNFILDKLIFVVKNKFSCSFGKQKINLNIE